jgi:hypothetical protein
MAKLTKPARDRISGTKFAFPKQRKEPLKTPLMYVTLSRVSIRRRASRTLNVMPHGSAYSLPQSATAWLAALNVLQVFILERESIEVRGPRRITEFAQREEARNFAKRVDIGREL